MLAVEFLVEPGYPSFFPPRTIIACLQGPLPATNRPPRAGLRLRGCKRNLPSSGGCKNVGASAEAYLDLGYAGKWEKGPTTLFGRPSPGA